MKCDDFRASAFNGDDSEELLAHLRSCVSCMNFAAAQDETYLFRALGGDDLVPPGGVDAFVGDVMKQIHAGETARRMERQRSASPRYLLSLAAAAALTALSFSLVPRNTISSAPVAVMHEAELQRHAELSRPVVEEYDNSSATIVEMDTDQNSSEDVKIVMIFDESLPADL